MLKVTRYATGGMLKLWKTICYLKLLKVNYCKRVEVECICPICMGEEVTLSHIFDSCEFVVRVWGAVGLLAPWQQDCMTAWLDALLCDRNGDTVTGSVVPWWLCMGFGWLGTKLRLIVACRLRTQLSWSPGGSCVHGRLLRRAGGRGRWLWQSWIRSGRTTYITEAGTGARWMLWRFQQLGRWHLAFVFLTMQWGLFCCSFQWSASLRSWATYDRSNGM